MFVTCKPGVWGVCVCATSKKKIAVPKMASAPSMRPKNKFIKKRRLRPIVAYSEGPKTAFEYNRVRRALLKYHTGRETAHPVAPTVVRRLFQGEPTDPQDTASEPAFRSLSGEPSQASNPNPPKYAIQTVQRAEADEADEADETDETDVVVTANSNMADAELEKVVVRDATRDEIDRNLKGLHSQKLCTRREMAGSVMIFLLQRMVPKEAIDVLTASTYRLFDVKSLHYGDFVNRSLRVKIDNEFVNATTTAYHSFDGFKAIYTNSGGNETEITIKHATEWKWA